MARLGALADEATMHPATFIEDEDDLDLDEVKLEEERQRLLRAAARKRARELGIDPRQAIRAALLEIPLELLQGVEFYAGSPVLKPAPSKDNPLRKLINLNSMSREQTLEWLRRQGTRTVMVALDPINDTRLDPSGSTKHYQWYQLNGPIWPIEKGRMVEVPWPIGEDLEEKSLEARSRQYVEAGTWRDGKPLV